MEPTLIIDPGLSPCPTLPALIWAEGIAAPVARPSLPDFLAEVVARARGHADTFWPAGLKERVRDMIRHGRYKPAGRGKPASEFLLGAAQGDDFPTINLPVDVNNAVSLESGYPGSIFDVARSGAELLVRRGLAGERYVFNTTGQVIELEDLLLVCRKTAAGGWEPCGNPVKDAMATKVNEVARDIVAVLFAPADEPRERVSCWAERFAKLLRDFGRARNVGYRVHEPS